MAIIVFIEVTDRKSEKPSAHNYRFFDQNFMFNSTSSITISNTSASYSNVNKYNQKVSSPELLKVPTQLITLRDSAVHKFCGDQA